MLPAFKLPRRQKGEQPIGSRAAAPTAAHFNEQHLQHSFIPPFAVSHVFKNAIEMSSIRRQQQKHWYQFNYIQNILVVGT
jgi:hypothetical protein